jgi:hypothetical protein
MACRFPPTPPAGLNRNRLPETPKFALFLDLVDLRLQLRIFLGLDGEQFPSQDGQVLIGLDVPQQRNQVSLPFGGSQAEFGCITADGVG